MDSVEALREVFAQFASPRDGRVAADDFQRLWEHLGLAAASDWHEPARIRELFRAMDSDGAGRVSFEQFVRTIESMLLAGKLGNLSDPESDHDADDAAGSDNEVFESESPSERRTQLLRGLFDECDQQGRGYITFPQAKAFLPEKGFAEDHVHAVFSRMRANTPTHRMPFDEFERVMCTLLDELEHPDADPPPQRGRATPAEFPPEEPAHKKDLRQLRSVFDAHNTNRRGFITVDQIDDVWRELGNRGPAPESLKADLIRKSSDLFPAGSNAVSEAAFLTVFMGRDYATTPKPGMPRTLSSLAPATPLSATHHAHKLRSDSIVASDSTPIRNASMAALEREVSNLRTAVSNKDEELAASRFEIQRMKEQQDKLNDLGEEHVGRLNDELRLEKDISEQRRKDLQQLRTANTELQRENDAVTKRVKRGPSVIRNKDSPAHASRLVHQDTSAGRMQQEVEELTLELNDAVTREATLQLQIQEFKFAEVELIKVNAERDGLRKDLDEHVRVILDLRSAITKLQDLNDELREAAHSDRRPTAELNQTAESLHTEMQGDLSHMHTSMSFDEHMLLKRQLEAANASLDDTRSRHHDELRQSRAELTRVSGELGTKLSSLQNFNDRLSASIADQQRIINDLNAAAADRASALEETERLMGVATARANTLQDRLDRQKQAFDAQQAEAHRSFEDLHGELQIVYRELQECYGKDTLAFVRDNSKLKKRVRELERFKEAALQQHRSAISAQGDIKNSFTELTEQVTSLLHERRELVSHIGDLGKEIANLRETNSWILKSQKSLQSLQEQQRSVKAKAKMHELMLSTDAHEYDNPLLAAYKVSLKNRDDRIAALETRLAELALAGFAKASVNSSAVASIEQDLVSNLLEDQHHSVELLGTLKRRHDTSMEAANTRVADLETKNEQLRVHIAQLESQLAEQQFRAAAAKSSPSPKHTRAQNQGLLQMIENLQHEKVQSIREINHSLDRLHDLRTGASAAASASAPKPKLSPARATAPATPPKSDKPRPIPASEPRRTSRDESAKAGRKLMRSISSLSRSSRHSEASSRPLSRASSASSVGTTRPMSVMSHVSVADELRMLNTAAKSPFLGREKRPSRGTSIKLIRNMAESLRGSHISLVSLASPARPPQQHLKMQVDFEARTLEMDL